MKYALRRILVTAPLLLAVSLVVFALTDALPGDAADMRFEKHPAAKEQWRAERGLDDPFVVRWLRYVGGVVTGFDRPQGHVREGLRPVQCALVEGDTAQDRGALLVVQQAQGAAHLGVRGRV